MVSASVPEAETADARDHRCYSDSTFMGGFEQIHAVTLAKLLSPSLHAQMILRPKCCYWDELEPPLTLIITWKTCSSAKLGGPRAPRSQSPPFISTRTGGQ